MEFNDSGRFDQPSEPSGGSRCVGAGYRLEGSPEPILPLAGAPEPEVTVEPGVTVEPELGCAAAPRPLGTIGK